MITDFAESQRKQKAWEEMISQCERQFLWIGDVPDFDQTLGQQKPSLIFFKAENPKASRACVLIIVGGGYMFKALGEAVPVAQKLNSEGLHTAILDYRIVPYSRNTILIDAKRAMRFLRYNANSLEIDADKIAVMGFSAGGNLATLLALNSDDGDSTANDPVERFSCRPNALILCYPAVNIVKKYEDDDDFSLLSYFDIVIDQKQDNFPPTFIWHSMSDRLINHCVSMELAEALCKMNVPVELHLFPYGGHGQGLAQPTERVVSEEDKLTSCWSNLCVRWLDFYGF